LQSQSGASVSSLRIISKHIKVLEKINLITKTRRGREQVVIVVPRSLKVARAQLARYEKMWEERFSRLDELLEKDQARRRP
jgi:hypothetical protein